MTGSTEYSIVWTTKTTKKYERTLKKLAKLYKGKSDRQVFKQFVSEQLQDRLCSDPYLPQSRSEPSPSNIILPEGLEFRKMTFKMQPRRGGASGEGRLMYLVDWDQYLIILAWIYTKDEFSGRPDDESLMSEIKDAIDSVD
jgi:hypothetical protein